MGETDSLYQLIVFVLIAVAWAIKGILDARRQKQRPRRAPPAEGRQERPEVQEQPEVIVHPQPVRPKPLRAMPAAAALGSVAERHLVGGRRLLRSSHAAAAHGATVLKQRRTSAYQRLSGGLSVVPGRALTQAGILWSEILGPCRALKGPHRPPHVSRRHG